ncbi:hypothetical protein KBB96_17615 [Luteolibacter ambystomatis]|uniref:Lipoprotein n=1 Tax=Luteolibacter ambystomatis TaxID=2824561 RepID=A0A975G7T1_9BACT|nr:hypothetical protein [Luteolibacter ambystomatis]QUE50664.1 hypothetical protein KBB96_17615 [Luteolibacter ambystomatis]
MKSSCYYYLPAIAAAAVLVSCKDSKSGDSASSSSSTASDTVVLAKADSLPKAGTKLTASRKMAMKDATMKVSAGGQNMDGTASVTETETTTIEFASADKVKSTVTAGEKAQTTKMNGQDIPNEPQPNSLLNVPVVYTKKDGKWTGALESGTATAAQTKDIAKLEKKLNKPKDASVYGTSPHKVGDSWTVDAADLAFADDDNETKGSLKLTFKGIETYEGKKCARLEGPLELTGKTAADKGSLDLSMKGDMVILRAIDEMIDMKTDFKGKMEMKGNIPGGTMSMEGGIVVDESNKIN